MNNKDELNRLEEVGRRLVPAELVSQWRVGNLRGDTSEKLQTLTRWAAEDRREELTAAAEANAKREKPAPGVLRELQEKLRAGVDAKLSEGGLPAALEYLTQEEALWKTAQEIVPSLIEKAKQDRERHAHELKERLAAISKNLIGIRGRRLNQSLSELVALRNAMSFCEANQARATVINNYLIEPMLIAVVKERESVLSLEKRLADVGLGLGSEAEELKKWAETLDVFEEKVGSRADLADCFGDAHVDVRPKLAAWRRESTNGVARIYEEVLRELEPVDQALASHCLIDKRPEEFIERIGNAERLTAPYVDLAYDPVNAPLHATLLTGYQGDVNVAAAIPQGIQITRSPSLGTNEVILAQVRLGVPLDALAGLDEWRRAAEQTGSKLPLYTVEDPEALEPL